MSLEREGFLCIWEMLSEMSRVLMKTVEKAKKWKFVGTIKCGSTGAFWDWVCLGYQNQSTPLHHWDESMSPQQRLKLVSFSHVLGGLCEGSCQRWCSFYLIRGYHMHGILHCFTQEFRNWCGLSWVTLWGQKKGSQMWSVANQKVFETLL